jgi:hypothetical protein
MPAGDIRAERRNRSQSEWGRRWTKDELLRLHVMLNAGYDCADIGMLLSRAIESFVVRAEPGATQVPERRPQTSRSAGRS